MAQLPTFWLDSTTPGIKLLGRRWVPDNGEPVASALLVHGVGEHSGRYDEAAGKLTDLGIEVLGYDLRGFGRSGGDKGRIPHPATYVEDAARIFQSLQPGKDGKPPFLVAHSMGGAISAFAVTSGAIAPRGLVLSSPAIRPRVLPFAEAALRRLAVDQPDLALPSGIQDRNLTHDKDILKAIKSDDAMHRTVSPRLIVSMLDQGASALARAWRISIPTLVLIAAADKIVEPDAERQFAASIPGSLATTGDFTGLFHEVFNETPTERKKVFKALQQWLSEQLHGAAPRPIAARKPAKKR